MSLLSELPLYQTILEAEKKHGLKTHMLIEAIPLDGKDADDLGNDPEETNIFWLVEFEYQKKIFESFDQVRKFLLDEAVATREGPVVEYEGSSEEPIEISKIEI